MNKTKSKMKTVIKEDVIREEEEEKEMMIAQHSTYIWHQRIKVGIGMLKER